MSRALGLLAGFVADRVVPDPARFHPVAGFGTLAAAPRATQLRARPVPAEPCTPGSSSASAVVAGAALERRRPLHRDSPRHLGGARRVLAGTRGAGRLRPAGRRPAARGPRNGSPTWSVATPAALTEDEVARAVVESVAENTSDAVVAPLVLGAVLGVPGLLGYRAANTLDAMVGHRNARYSDFGWASARLDDLLNLPGSRLTALLAALLGPAPARCPRRLGSRRLRPSLPQRRPGRGLLRRRARHPARRGEHLRRPRRAPRRPRLRPRAERRATSSGRSPRPPRRPRGRGDLRAAGPPPPEAIPEGYVDGPPGPST